MFDKHILLISVLIGYLNKKAKSLNADLIVTGARGAGTVRRTLMGSVSDYLVHHSHKPVLVCKHPDFHNHHGHHNQHK
ncbi:hypothetical protein KUTeg_001037 [Tegillarca granosa]|uniref:UspA domain-containing protein n=1 Tax=Tegillarca granosa TaxID=220873 RepID=A0ABQ9FW11_TEGGR|nr:hypothetical protein KUTeg_001037 [Tegillarca granosa]